MITFSKVRDIIRKYEEEGFHSFRASAHFIKGSDRHAVSIFASYPDKPRVRLERVYTPKGNFQRAKLITKSAQVNHWIEAHYVYNKKGI